MIYDVLILFGETGQTMALTLVMIIHNSGRDACCILLGTVHKTLLGGV